MKILSLFLVTVLITVPVMAKELPDPGSLPGGWFYPVKRWVEDVGDWFTFGSTRTMNRLLDRTSLRLVEANALVSSDKKDLIIKASQAYTDVWQEFWLVLDGEDDISTFTEQAVRLLMDHRRVIGSTREELENIWTHVLNLEIRGLTLLTEKYPEQGLMLLTAVFMDRIQMLPVTTVNDILALDPLVGLLRTRGEKEVITMMIQALSVFDTVPESSDRNQIQQHMMQTMQGDLVRFTAVQPDDAVKMLQEILHGRLMRMEAVLQGGEESLLLEALGDVSIVIGWAEEMAGESMVRSHPKAMDALKNTLENLAGRLTDLPVQDRDDVRRMVEDQQTRLAMIGAILQNSMTREDALQYVPEEVLKIFPDFPWKIPIVPGTLPMPRTSSMQREDRGYQNLFEQQPDVQKIQDELRSTLSPFLPVQEQLTLEEGEDPLVRLPEMLIEKNATLSPIPVDGR